MKQANAFSDYYFEKAGTLGPKQALKQANMLFGHTIDYKSITENEIYFKDGSAVEYTMSEGVKNIIGVDFGIAVNCISIPTPPILGRIFMDEVVFDFQIEDKSKRLNVKQ